MACSRVPLPSASRQQQATAGRRQAPPDPSRSPPPPAAAAPSRQRPNELDAAYAEIPAAERETWYERADRTLAAADMPEWMRITPTVKERALRLWVGSTIPDLATG